MDEPLRNLAIESLKKFFGLPPYDFGINPAKGDSHFLQAMERMYRLSLSRLEQETGFDKIRQRWEDYRQRFMQEVG